jgi:alcohol dehydrogenase, propanol-preferring
VFSAMRKAFPLDLDDAVVLVGTGALGLSAIAMVRALGHQKIVPLDIGADKLESARHAGATAMVNSAGENPVQEVLNVADGPVLAVIDLVNGSKRAAPAFSVLTKGGEVVHVGVMGGQLNLSLVMMIFKAATIMGNNTGKVEIFRDSHKRESPYQYPSPWSQYMKLKL